MRRGAGTPPEDANVETGLRRFLRDNGYTFEQYDARWTPAKLFGIRFAVPNTRRHRWAIRLHDLHHVATGYGTDAAGEGEISAWECRRGVRPLGFYVGSIVIAGVLLGLLVAPRRMLRAWRAPGRRSSLFHERDTSFEDLLELDVGALRRRLGIPPGGLAPAGRVRECARRDSSLAVDSRQ